MLAKPARLLAAFEAAFTALLVAALALILSLAAAASAATLQVVSTSPARLAAAPSGSVVSIDFDRALLPASVTPSTLRVFGKQSGPASGAVSFSNGDRTLTLTPSHPFAAGEVVVVNLSHGIVAADASPLRAAGYAYQFRIATQVASRAFQEIARMSNRTTPSGQTEIYGAMAADLDGDGSVDLTTVNEVSADLRVFMNKGNGTGLFNAPAHAPFPIGLESSPNESGDFDGDGKVDIAISATSSGSVWVVHGKGDGSYGPAQHVAVGAEPHGIAALDVDGDADWDVVNVNQNSDNLSLLLNNAGVLGAPSFFESGGGGEYALGSGDMNGDGISDLVVGAQWSQTMVVLLGNGDGTFTSLPPQSAGGLVWKLVLGDVDGDGNLDVAAVNGDSNDASILLGNGDGTLQAPAVYPTAPHVVGTALGDLDGDGDLDWVISSYGGGLWHVLVNDGSGHFSFDPDIPAVRNPSCAILLDSDGDGDLDLALTDEIDDTIKFMRNGSAPAAPCPPAPSSCRTPAVAGKATLRLTDKTPDSRDAIAFSWLSGKATPKADFGDPLTTDGYSLCIYDNGDLVSSESAPAGGICGRRDCWKSAATSFTYSDLALTPDGVSRLQLREGLTDGKAAIQLQARGLNLDMPPVASLVGPIDVQIHKTSGGVCWGARYSAPFVKNVGGVLTDRAD